MKKDKKAESSSGYLFYSSRGKGAILANEREPAKPVELVEKEGAMMSPPPERVVPEGVCWRKDVEKAPGNGYYLEVRLQKEDV